MKGTGEISALLKSECHGDRGHHRGSHSGDQERFKRGQLPLSSSVREDRLLYSSASDMMAVKHKTAKNAMKAAASAPLAVVAVSTKSLKLLGTLNSENL
jgi:hypothetical protein